MRVLLELRRRLGNDFAAWPFEETSEARIVCAEVFPRFFLHLSDHGTTKVRTRDALNSSLKALGSDPYDGPEAEFADHQTDALVTAAGLRHIAGCSSIWSPKELDDRARRAEGWILGVVA